MAKKLLKCDFQVSPGQLYDLVLRAILHVGYSIITQNRSDGVISCKTGMTWKSWSGIELGILVTPSDNGRSEVAFGGGTVATSGMRPMQIAVIGNAVKGPAKKIVNQVALYIRKKDIPSDRPLYERPSGSVFSVSDELKKLSELRDSGVLSSNEFETQKKRLLSG